MKVSARYLTRDRRTDWNWAIDSIRRRDADRDRTLMSASLAASTFDVHSFIDARRWHTRDNGAHDLRSLRPHSRRVSSRISSPPPHSSRHLSGLPLIPTVIVDRVQRQYQIRIGMVVRRRRCWGSQRPGHGFDEACRQRTSLGSLYGSQTRLKTRWSKLKMTCQRLGSNRQK